MKTLIILSALLSASSLLACPNLEGTYSACYEDQIFDENKNPIGGRIHNVIIEQEKVDGKESYIFQYKDNDENDGTIRPHGSVVANGKTVSNRYDLWTRTDVEHEMTAKCQGDSLIINSKVSQNGKVVSETSETFTKLPDSKLKHSINGSAFGKSVSVSRDCQP